MTIYFQNYPIGKPIDNLERLGDLFLAPIRLLAGNPVFIGKQVYCFQGAVPKALALIASIILGPFVILGLLFSLLSCSRKKQPSIDLRSAEPMLRLHGRLSKALPPFRLARYTNHINDLFIQFMKSRQVDMPDDPKGVLNYFGLEQKELGYTPHSARLRVESFVQQFHPDSQENLRKAIEACLV